MELFYLTCPNKKEAKKIAISLLEKKLIFCANIISSVESIYIWKNQIEKSNEAILFIKAFKKDFSKIEKEIKKIHSYEIFALFSIPLSKISKRYKNYLQSLTLEKS